jgi:hypothetical protein
LAGNPRGLPQLAQLTMNIIDRLEKPWTLFSSDRADERKGESSSAISFIADGRREGIIRADAPAL